MADEKITSAAVEQKLLESIHGLAATVENATSSTAAQQLAAAAKDLAEAHAWLRRPNHGS